MKGLSANALRRAYLDFFVARGHKLVASDSLVPTDDPSVLFTSAGMNQFKDLFLGKASDFQTAVSCQKCLRTGDLQQVGTTPFHHTFFEMLGNFSFGSYFKKEAIAWAWELVTEVFEIEKSRLWVSVYEDDEEAFGLWRDDIGIETDRIRKFGQAENFWPANAITLGPNGPCGPCSEIYYTRGDGTSVEVWNLVFTQFNRCDNAKLEALPRKNIDTGMGLERMCSVLQGVDSNFKIDIFQPVVEAVKRAVEVAEEKLSYMIADHGRAAALCICDGVLPSNDGRGYVIRKLIRRCLYLSQARDKKPFLYKVVSSVCEAMAEPYPELKSRRDNIAGIIQAEEEKYIKNILEGGGEKLQSVIEGLKKSGCGQLPPEVGLDLYVTYGIQPDLTKERCEKQGLKVDLVSIQLLIQKEQDRSRARSRMSGLIFAKGSFPLMKTEFLGYEKDCLQAKVVQIVKDGQVCQEAGLRDNVLLVLDKTPFYGEAGGQVGDKGVMHLKGTRFKIKVEDAKRDEDSIFHCVQIMGHKDSQETVVKVGDEVEARVDLDHRGAVARAHTATHVLQAVLREVLGRHVQQAGSFVEADRFRFDFTHFKDITDDQMQDIQRLLNEHVIKNDPVSARSMSKQEAQKTGAIALFGEKYEDVVRVVSIADYSREFCGGTHLDFTGRIGLILIVSDSSVGSGLRRIEALTGRLAYETVKKRFELLKEGAQKLKTAPEQFLKTLDQLIARQKLLEKEFLVSKEKELKSEIETLIQSAEKIKEFTVITHVFKYFDLRLLRQAVDLLKKKVSKNGIFFLVGVADENTHCVCGLTKDCVELGLSADSLLKKILVPFGGSGGGRDDFAQGGLKEKVSGERLLKETEGVIKEVLKEAGPR